MEILPGKEGLLHISQISDERVANVTDALQEGDEVPVNVIEIDRMGKIRLSRKEVLSAASVPQLSIRTTLRSCQPTRLTPVKSSLGDMLAPYTPP